MNFAPLLKARRVLDGIWKQCLLKGRCWGLKREDNPFSCSNITMANKRELVTICQNEDGSLNIYEFRKAENTSLGAEVKNVLRAEGLTIKVMVHHRPQIGIVYKRGGIKKWRLRKRR